MICTLFELIMQQNSDWHGKNVQILMASKYSVSFAQWRLRVPSVPSCFRDTVFYSAARQLWLPSGVKQSSQDSLQGQNGRHGRHRGSVCTQRLYISQDNNNLITTQYFNRLYDMINMIVEFNVDSKAACDQLNLAQETKTNASTHLVQYRFKIREGSLEGIRRLWRKGFVKEMSFKSGVKG